MARSIISLAWLAVALAAQTWDLAKGKGEVSFKAVGRPSLLRIKGVGAAPAGKATIDKGIASGKFEFDLSTLDTGIGLRNRHMKEKYLEVGKHPKAVLELKGFKVPAGEEETPFSGTLTLHGVTKTVSGTTKLVREGGSVTVVAAFTIKLSDFGISTPSFADITVSETVDVGVRATAPLEGGAK